MKIKRILNSQKGLTLTEMLIAMVIFTLILFGSLLLIRYIYRNYGFEMEQGLSLNEVQKGLKVLVEEIRGTRQADSGAYPIQSADSFELVLFSDIDKDNITERVHYYLQNGEIKKGVTKPNGTPPSYPNEDDTISTVASHIVNTPTQPLFYFYDANYPADQTNNPLAVPVADVSKIRLVKIDMFYNLDPYRAPNNIRLESYVELRNLKDNW